MAHGGALLTFADSALGLRALGRDRPRPLRHGQPAKQFPRPPPSLGDLVTCSPEVVRKTREIVFMRADFHVGDRIVFTATAIWKIWPKT